MTYQDTYEWQLKCRTAGCSSEMFERHQAVALRFAQTQLVFANSQVLQAANELLYRRFCAGVQSLPGTDSEAEQWAKDLAVVLYGDLVIAASCLMMQAPAWFDEARRVWNNAKTT